MKCILNRKKKRFRVVQVQEASQNIIPTTTTKHLLKSAPKTLISLWTENFVYFESRLLVHVYSVWGSDLDWTLCVISVSVQIDILFVRPPHIHREYSAIHPSIHPSTTSEQFEKRCPITRWLRPKCELSHMEHPLNINAAGIWEALARTLACASTCVCVL